jgi:hypothetical protein
MLSVLKELPVPPLFTKFPHFIGPEKFITQFTKALCLWVRMATFFRTEQVAGLNLGRDKKNILDDYFCYFPQSLKADYRKLPKFTPRTNQNPCQFII